MVTIISTVSVKDLYIALQYAKLMIENREPISYNLTKLQLYQYNTDAKNLYSPTSYDRKTDTMNTLRHKIFRKQQAHFQELHKDVKKLLTEPFSVLIGFFPLRRRVGVNCQDNSDYYIEYNFAHCFFPEEIVCIVIPEEK